MKDLNLSIYNGVEASVNSYLFTDNDSAVLVDCLRNSEEAKRLASFVRDTGKNLTHILITHGHADHYIGASVLQKEFPNAKIVVTRQEVKDDIISFSNFMEGVGWLENESAMKPKTPGNPDGFDYESNIEVLGAREIRLANGATLELNSNYDSAECEHLTTIYSKDLNAFFSGDFCYNGVHPWLAIDKKHMVNWKEQLDRFSSELTTANLKVYPGHGKPSGVSLFAEVKKYIENFENAIANSTTRAEAMKKMKTLYPEFEQADFLLVHSVNAAIEQ